MSDFCYTLIVLIGADYQFVQLIFKKKHILKQQVEHFNIALHALSHTQSYSNKIRRPCDKLYFLIFF